MSISLVCRSVVMFVAVLLFSAAAMSSETKESDSSEVVATMNSIRTALQAGDLQSWEQLVAPECQFVEPGGRITDRSWHAPRVRTGKPNETSSALKPEVKLSQVQVHIFDEAATLTYREDVTTHVGDQTIATKVRFTEVYQRSNGKWRMISSAETPIKEKTPAAIDFAVYADYVGEYQMAPELVGRVYRDGDKLMLIGTGWKQPYELLPLGHDTFFIKEFADNEIVFVRDTSGKVIAQGPGAGGKGPTGKKIK